MMKKKSIRNRKRAHKIKMMRVGIVFITGAIFIAGIVAILTHNIFTKSKDVSVTVTEQAGLKSTKIREEDQKNKIEKTVLSKNDLVIDDVSNVEKYLLQEYKGIKPTISDEKKIAYLTFDDGPSETVTPKILDILKENNVKATFFIVGQALEKSDQAKGILIREASEGHSIGNHTYSHNYKYLYPNRIINVKNFMADIEKTNVALKKILGNDFSTRAIRFPGGHMSWKGTKAIDETLASNDYHQVDWNSLSKDAEGKHKKASELINCVKETVKGKQKAIILMHDTYGKEETAKALPEIIRYLKEEGYEFRIMK